MNEQITYTRPNGDTFYVDRTGDGGWRYMLEDADGKRIMSGFTSIQAPGEAIDWLNTHVGIMRDVFRAALNLSASEAASWPTIEE